MRLQTTIIPNNNTHSQYVRVVKSGRQVGGGLSLLRMLRETKITVDACDLITLKQWEIIKCVDN